MTQLTVEQLLPLLQDPRVSATVHAYADTDIGQDALHHTIGPGSAQVLEGNHTFGFDDFTQADQTPNAPTGITVTSNTLPSQDGVTYVQAIISWTPVTQNTDGTSLTADDLDAYLVSWRNSSPVGDWSPDFEVNPDSPIAYFTGLKPGTVIDVRVVARNLAQNDSAPGYAFSQTLGADLTPPNQPSKPVVASLFGAIRVQWDGKDSVGAQMALDFDHVDVHVSTTSTFIADDSNKVDSIPTLNGGTVILSYIDYGTDHYVKFRAVDKSSNISTQSVASDPVAARQGVDADFANVSATKIATGKLSVDVGLGGRILIGPLDASGNLISPLGARMELRNDGIHIFNGSNVEVATMAIISGVPQINISGPIVSGGSITGAVIQTSGSGVGYLKLDGATDTFELYDDSGLVGKIYSEAFIMTIDGLGAKLQLDDLSVYVTGNLERASGENYLYTPSSGNSINGGRFTGATNGSGQVTINHGIGNTPITFGASSAAASQIIRNYAKSSSSITFEVRNDSGALVASTSVTLDWWALG